MRLNTEPLPPKEAFKLDEKFKLDLAYDLMRLPDEINQLRVEVLKQSIELENAKKSERNHRLDIMSEITKAKGEDGKTLFTNDTLREAELRVRLSKSLEWDRIQDKLQTEDFKLGETKIQLEWACDSFAGRKAVARMFEVRSE